MLCPSWLRARLVETFLGLEPAFIFCGLAYALRGASPRLELFVPLPSGEGALW